MSSNCGICTHMKTATFKLRIDPKTLEKARRKAEEASLSAIMIGLLEEWLHDDVPTRSVNVPTESVPTLKDVPTSVPTRAAIPLRRKAGPGCLGPIAHESGLCECK